MSEKTFNSLTDASKIHSIVQKVSPNSQPGKYFWKKQQPEKAVFEQLSKENGFHTKDQQVKKAGQTNCQIKETEKQERLTSSLTIGRERRISVEI